MISCGDGPASRPDDARGAWPAGNGGPAARHGRTGSAGAPAHRRPGPGEPSHRRPGPLHPVTAHRRTAGRRSSTPAPRWPRFAPRAIASGFQSVHALPLRLRSQIFGALNVFGDTKGGDFSGTDVPIVQSLADMAAIALLQERALRRGEALTEQLQGALNSRIVIEQAKGAVAYANGVSVDEAFTRIRNYARNHNRKLTDVAHALVNDRTTPPELD
ncbi:ANTAR domain-containing protein [Actinoplanes missouriensis]|uniref:ANTAR domain-containing protein n=1 Tax=Actinoplanes missouriensis TaxID=1866 RepID=UPI0033D3A73B